MKKQSKTIKNNQKTIKNHQKPSKTMKKQFKTIRPRTKNNQKQSILEEYDKTQKKKNGWMDGKFDRNTFFDFLEIRLHRKRDFAHNGRKQF